MKLFSVCVCVLALTTAGASAAIVDDFEGYDVGDPFAGGTIVEDPTDPGNKVLHLPGGASASWAAPGSEGIVTVDVYDMGSTATDEDVDTTNGYGPRWAVSGPVGTSGISIIEKTFIDSQTHYGFSDGSKTGSWWTVGSYGPPRHVESLQVIGDGTWDNPDVPGEGAWNTWTFYVAANGEVTVSDGTQMVLLPDGQWDLELWLTEGMDEIWVSGGRSGQPMNGTAYFDNITYVIPEPATLGLLGLGALALIRRRR